MKHAWIFASMVVGLGACGQASKTPPTPAPEVTPAPEPIRLVDVDEAGKQQDAELSQRVRDALDNDPLTSAFSARITISSRAGLVTLRGQVESPEQQQRLIDRTLAVSGVQDVDDQISMRL
jgi:hypothetical protein